MEEQIRADAEKKLAAAKNPNKNQVIMSLDGYKLMREDKERLEKELSAAKKELDELKIVMKRNDDFDEDFKEELRRAGFLEACDEIEEKCGLLIGNEDGSFDAFVLKLREIKQLKEAGK